MLFGCLLQHRGDGRRSNRRGGQEIKYNIATLRYQLLYVVHSTYISSTALEMATDCDKFPGLFRDRPVVDRSQASRTTPMRLLVFGLMRTGTSSMFEALAALGIKEVYHMQSDWKDPDDAQWWLRAFRAKYHNEGSFGNQDWDKLLGHCQVGPPSIPLGV